MNNFMNKYRQNNLYIERERKTMNRDRKNQTNKYIKHTKTHTTHNTTKERTTSSKHKIK